MPDSSHKHQSLKDKVSAFILTITISMGTNKGREAVDTLVKYLDLINLGIKIGFKLILFTTVLLLLYLLSRYL
jgi:hypothetical protein